MIFDQDQRGVFGGLADVLIPEGNGMPSASQAEVAGRWLDAVLESRPELGDGLHAVLQKAAQRQPGETQRQPGETQRQPGETQRQPGETQRQPGETQRQPEAVVQQLRHDDPEAFGLLAEIVTNAYFMNPSVRDAIGYAGQPGREIDPRPDYMEDGLLESVICRGPIFRPTPDTDGESA